MENHIEKIEKSAKAIKTIIGLLIIITTLIYGFCIYVYQNQKNQEELFKLKDEFIQYKAESILKYQDISARVSQNEKNFQMNAAKLEVTLARITTDLQFIKESLMKKGLEK